MSYLKFGFYTALVAVLGFGGGALVKEFQTSFVVGAQAKGHVFHGTVNRPRKGDAEPLKQEEREQDMDSRLVTEPELTPAAQVPLVVAVAEPSEPAEPVVDMSTTSESSPQVTLQWDAPAWKSDPADWEGMNPPARRKHAARTHPKTPAPRGQTPRSGNCMGFYNALDKTHEALGRAGLDPLSQLQGQMPAQAATVAGYVGGVVTSVFYTALYAHCKHDLEAPHSAIYVSIISSLIGSAIPVPTPPGMISDMVGKAIPFMSGCTNPEAVEYYENPAMPPEFTPQTRAAHYFAKHGCPGKAKYVRTPTVNTF